MKEIWNPHDRLFKEIWSEREAAADFVSRYLPEDVRGLIAPNTVELCKDSFVSADLREYFSDLLYRVSIEGRDGYLYVLLEHKSWAPLLICYQLLGYIKGIWDMHLKQGEWIMTLAEKIKNEGIQQGIQQGLLEGIAALIEIKFGQSGLKLLPEIE